MLTACSALQEADENIIAPNLMELIERDNTFSSMGAVSRPRGRSSRVDDSVPFNFLLGDKYLGYKQAINSTRDLKPMPSKLPRLFLGLSNEQRRLLATRILEAGHSGEELERAIHLAIWGEESSRRSTRVPSRVQPWDKAHEIEGGLNGIGPDGRPIVPERFKPREPFLVVAAADEVHRFGPEGRVEKPHERRNCDPAKWRRKIQEMMRTRVEVQKEFLDGLERDRREWLRYRTRRVKSGAIAPARRRRQARLAYGSDQFDPVGSRRMSHSLGYDEARREKQEMARVLKAVREAELKANAEAAMMRRWEKEVLKTMRAEAATSLSGASKEGCKSASDVGVAGLELARALQELSVDSYVDGRNPDTASTSPLAEARAGRREGGRGGTPVTTPGKWRQRAALVQGQLLVAAREASPDDSKRQPLQPPPVFSGAVEGWSETTERTPPPTRPYRGRSTTRVKGQGEKADVHMDGVGALAATASTSTPPTTPAPSVAGEGRDASDALDAGEGEERSDKDEKKQKREEEGRDLVKRMVGKLLHTSSSVALVAARPLSIKPPHVLEVEKDAHQAKLVSEIQARKQRRFPPPVRSKSERIFVGGGYRTNSADSPCCERGGGVDGGGDDGRSTALKANQASNAGRLDECTGRTRVEAAHPSASPPRLLSATAATAGVLDLEAVATAAERSRGGSGGRGGAISSSEGTPAHRHARNRFAPMAENELERFRIHT